MEVHLLPEQEQFVQQRLREGAYHNVDELMQQAVSELQMREVSRSECASQHSIEGLIAALQSFPYPEISFEHEKIYAPISEPVSFA